MTLENISPKGYSVAARSGRESIRILQEILDPTLFQPYLAYYDTIPNTDGYIELTSEEGIPLGRIDVQVKTMRKRYRVKSFSCEVEFLSYCNRSVGPVILIAVDQSNRIAYWRHMSKEFLSSINLPAGKRTFSVKFPTENVIESGNNNCYEKWLQIIDELKRIVSDGSRILERMAAMAEQQRLLIKHGIAAVERSEEFKEIHVFLDHYNGLLDREFATVKQLFYRDIWKVGVAYAAYRDNSAEFCFYPIYWDCNGSLIKKYERFDDILESNEEILVTTYMAENPIRERPREFALERIKKDIKDLIKDKALLLGTHAFAYEQICYFIDRYYLILNLEPQKDAYKLTEVIDAYKNHLPGLIAEYAMRNGIQEDSEIDLDNIMMGPEEADEISKLVKSKKSTKGTYLIYSKNVDVPYIQQMLEFFNDQKIEWIQRIIRLGKRPNKETYFIWEPYTPEILKGNLEQFYNLFPSMYNLFISTYFPMLYTELNYFAEFDKQLIQFSYKNDRFSNYGPSIKIYNLKEDYSLVKDHGAIILNIDEEDAIISDNRVVDINFRNNIEINGKTYRLISAQEGGTDFIYEDRPIYETLYQELKDRFEQYFKTHIKKNVIDKFSRIG